MTNESTIKTFNFHIMKCSDDNYGIQLDYDTNIETGFNQMVKEDLESATTAANDDNYIHKTVNINGNKYNVRLIYKSGVPYNKSLEIISFSKLIFYGITYMVINIFINNIRALFVIRDPGFKKELKLVEDNEGVDNNLNFNMIINAIYIKLIAKQKIIFPTFISLIISTDGDIRNSSNLENQSIMLDNANIVKFKYGAMKDINNLKLHLFYVNFDSFYSANYNDNTIVFSKKRIDTCSLEDNKIKVNTNKHIINFNMYGDFLNKNLKIIIDNNEYLYNKIGKNSMFFLFNIKIDTTVPTSIESYKDLRTKLFNSLKIENKISCNYLQIDFSINKYCYIIFLKIIEILKNFIKNNEIFNNIENFFFSVNKASTEDNFDFVIKILLSSMIINNKKIFINYKDNLDFIIEKNLLTNFYINLLTSKIEFFHKIFNSKYELKLPNKFNDINNFKHMNLLEALDFFNEKNNYEEFRDAYNIFYDNYI